MWVRGWKVSVIAYLICTGICQICDWKIKHVEDSVRMSNPWNRSQDLPISTSTHTSWGRSVDIDLNITVHSKLMPPWDVVLTRLVFQVSWFICPCVIITLFESFKREFVLLNNITKFEFLCMTHDILSACLETNF